MALSARGKVASKPNSKFLLWKILQDLWDPEINPSGYVSLGVAENLLMHDSITQHASGNFKMTAQMLTYGDGMTGSKRLRVAMADFLNKHIHPFQIIGPEQITVTNGCSASVEHLSWALSNPGDGILLGRPYFRGFVPSVELRSAAKIIPVSFGNIDPYGEDAVQMYEKELIRCRKADQPVSIILVCNPHNPTGRCYTHQALLGLMRLCEEHEIHLVIDEIYAFSVWRSKDETGAELVPFESCLSVDPTSIIDPSRIHVIWGLSKDLGANGLRIGAIISQSNSSLHAALVPAALYSSSSSVADHVSANLLEDLPWMDNYLAQNQQRLAENYTYVTKWAQSNGIDYLPGVNAAFFLWADFGKAFSERHPELSSVDAESAVDQAFLNHRVFVAAGEQFGSEKAGWFRLTFAYPKGWLEEGLSRIICALDTKWQNEHIA